MIRTRPGPGGGLPAQMDPALHRLLRRAVLEYAAGETRRRHEPRLFVGLPGAGVAVLDDHPDEPLDHALRSDVVAAMARRTRHATPLVWLARPGDLAEAQDPDLAWLAAARAAYSEAGRPLVYVVTNRHGWRDPRSGVGRTWTRLRPPPVSVRGR